MPEGEKVMNRTQTKMVESETAPVTPAAWRALLDKLARRHGPMLHTRAVRLTGSTAEGWDLLHDTYERAMRAQPQVQTEQQALGWLVTVMRNLYLDRLRARRRRPELPLERPEWVPSPPEEQDPPWAALTMTDVLASLPSVAAPMRAVYQLHVLEGLSYAEIAKRLRVPPATVGTRLHRARARIKAALLEDDQESAAA
jgi:RNA polymerase sigma-70 factor (ECF subfamily)